MLNSADANGNPILRPLLEPGDAKSLKQAVKRFEELVPSANSQPSGSSGVQEGEADGAKEKSKEREKEKYPCILDATQLEVLNKARTILNKVYQKPASTP